MDAGAYRYCRIGRPVSLLFPWEKKVYQFAVQGTTQQGIDWLLRTLASLRHGVGLGCCKLKVGEIRVSVIAFGVSQQGYVHPKAAPTKKTTKSLRWAAIIRKELNTNTALSILEIYTWIVFYTSVSYLPNLGTWLPCICCSVPSDSAVHKNKVQSHST